jgi:hypothetical protein
VNLRASCWSDVRKKRVSGVNGWRRWSCGVPMWSQMKPGERFGSRVLCRLFAAGGGRGLRKESPRNWVFRGLGRLGTMREALIGLRLGSPPQGADGC